MSLRSKLFLLFFSLSLGFLLFLARDTHSLFVESQKQRSLSELQKRVGLFSLLVEGEIDQWRRQVLSLAMRRESGDRNVLSETRGVPWLVRLSRNEQQAWQADWIEAGEATEDVSVAEVARKVYQELSVESLSPEAMTLTSMSFPGRDLVEKKLMLAVPVLAGTQGFRLQEDAIYVALFNASRWLENSAMLKVFQGPQRMIDDRGVVLLAEDNQWLGRDQSSEELERSVLAERNLQGVLEVSLDGSAHWLAYQRLSSVNAYFLTSTAAVASMTFRQWLLGGSIALLALMLFAAVLISRWLEEKERVFGRLKNVLADLAQGRLQTSISERGSPTWLRIATHLKMIQSQLLEERLGSATESREVVPQSPGAPLASDTGMSAPQPASIEDEVAGRKIRDLADKLSSSLTTILGSAQKGRQLSRHPEVLDCLNAVVREAEELRGEFNEVELFGSSLSEVTEECSLVEVTNNALQQLEDELQGHGLIVRKDYQTLPSLRVPELRLQAVMVELLRSSMEAARRAEKKVIQVGMTLQGKAVCWSVIDWAVHDPLVETDGEKFTDLGLLGALQAIRELGGDLLVDYRGNNQRRLEFSIPLNDQECRFPQQVILTENSVSALHHRRVQGNVETPELPGDFESELNQEGSDQVEPARSDGNVSGGR